MEYPNNTLYLLFVQFPESRTTYHTRVISINGSRSTIKIVYVSWYVHQVSSFVVERSLPQFRYKGLFPGSTQNFLKYCSLPPSRKIHTRFHLSNFVVPINSVEVSRKTIFTSLFKRSPSSPSTSTFSIRPWDTGTRSETNSRNPYDQVKQKWSFYETWRDWSRSQRERTKGGSVTDARRRHPDVWGRHPTVMEGRGGSL